MRSRGARKCLSAGTNPGHITTQMSRWLHISPAGLCKLPGRAWNFCTTRGLQTQWLCLDYPRVSQHRGQDDTQSGTHAGPAPDTLPNCAITLTLNNKIAEMKNRSCFGSSLHERLMSVIYAALLPPPPCRGHADVCGLCCHWKAVLRSVVWRPG